MVLLYIKLKTMLKKYLFTASILSIGMIASAQPRCFIVGPSFSMQSNTMETFSFTRTIGMDADGAPTTTFSNILPEKCSGKGVGLTMDLYLKRTRFAFDLMFPLKGSYTNVFNFNWAWGGYIKGKVGILAGLIFYSNPANYNVTPTDPNLTLANLSDSYNSSGNFYTTSGLKSCGGINFMLTYAHSEKMVFRADYALMLGSADSKKNPLQENYNWDGKAKRLELAAVWQFSDYFGAALKFNLWNSVGQYTTKASYNPTSNPSGTSETEIDVFPEQKFKSSNFMISIMIPLGSAESQSGTIDIAR